MVQASGAVHVDVESKVTYYPSLRLPRQQRGNLLAGRMDEGFVERSSSTFCGDRIRFKLLAVYQRCNNWRLDVTCITPAYSRRGSAQADQNRGRSFCLRLPNVVMPKCGSATICLDRRISGALTAAPAQ